MQTKRLFTRCNFTTGSTSIQENKWRQIAEHPSRSIIALSFAGAFAFLYLRTFLLPATPFIAIDDQILFFARAARIVHGQIPYRDFFELVTPGTDLLYAAAFRLFGIHAWIMQAWCILVGLALSAVITLIARKILRGPVILLPLLLFLVFDFNSGLDMTHHWYSTLAAMAAVGVLTCGVSLKRIFTAGLLCGVATLFTQTQGAMTFVAFLVYLLWLKRSKTEESRILTQLAMLVLPFLLVVSCVLGYYIHKAGFHTIFFDLVVFAPRFMSSIEINQPRTYLDQIRGYLGQVLQEHKLADSIGLIPVVFIYASVPYIYFLGFHRMWRNRNVMPTALQQPLVLLHLVGLALFVAVVSGPRFFRLCTVAPPAIIICTWLVSQQSPVQKLARNLLCLTAIVFAFLLPLRRQTQWHGILNLPIGRTAFSDPFVFHEFQWIAARTHPSEFFFNDSALSLYLSLNNPTASEFVTYDEFTRPDQVNAVIQSLQHYPPHFIVLLPESTQSSDTHDHAALFRQYAHTNYHLAQVFYLDHSRYRQELWERGPTLEP